jgi:2'-5' RNA ligase
MDRRRNGILMARLFAALRFPEAVNDRLEEIAHGIPGAVWTPAEQFHLTLRFLGDPAPLPLGDAERALREVRAESFRFDLRGAGHFPLRGDPETLWIGVAPCEPLLRLQRRVEAALQRAGLAPEGRKFHPHVSLARVRRADPRRVAEFQIVNGLFALRDIPAQEFVLCSSELRPEGAVHRVEAIYPLEGLLEGDEGNQEFG